MRLTGRVASAQKKKGKTAGLSIAQNCTNIGASSNETTPRCKPHY